MKKLISILAILFLSGYSFSRITPVTSPPDTTPRLISGLTAYVVGSSSADNDGDGIINANDIDDDGDGLIEITNLDQLNNMRHNLGGTRYGDGSTNTNTGCPSLGCNGYELMASLNFATASDYASGSINADWRPDHVDPSKATNAGWVSIGSYINRLTAIFEGNGHTITNLYVNKNGDYAGLIGYAAQAIRNIGLIDNYIKGSGNYVGGLVGVVGGTYGTVSNSYAMGAVSGTYSVAGLVGYVWDGTVSNSYAMGTVTGTGRVGGLVGWADGTVINSYAAGTVAGTGDGVGGLVGFVYTNGTVSNSYATGTVMGTGRVGGLVGWADGTVNNSYATGSVSGDNEAVGGLVGGTYGAVSNSYATGTVAGTGGHVGGLVGSVYESGTVGNSYATGIVTGTGGYVGGLVGYVWDGTVSNSYATGTVTVTGSNSNSVGGLVGFTNGAVSNSYATGAVSGIYSVGGLVGWVGNNGTVSNSYTTGTVTSGGDQVGGLVGVVYGTVINSYAMGAVSGNDFVGGLVGYVYYGTVSNSYFVDDDDDGTDGVGYCYQDDCTITNTTKQTFTWLEDTLNESTDAYLLWDNSGNDANWGNADATDNSFPCIVGLPIPTSDGSVSADATICTNDD